MKAEVMNITVTGNKVVKLLDNELGTILQVNSKVMLNTFDGGDQILADLPWNSKAGKAILEFVVDNFDFANMSFDIETDTVRYEVRDKEGNRVMGIVNARHVKLSTMCREIAGGVCNITYIANANIRNADHFENVAYNFATLLEKFGK